MASRCWVGGARAAAEKVGGGRAVCGGASRRVQGESEQRNAARRWGGRSALGARVSRAKGPSRYA
jgi:hypothetical protein